MPERLAMLSENSKGTGRYMVVNFLQETAEPICHRAAPSGIFRCVNVYVEIADEEACESPIREVEDVAFCAPAQDLVDQAQIYRP